ncbi:hypothetical protein [Marinobacter sediminicola]|uniref:hypothetical protein n=1 Tax=Marinobacter sediminicola TaxID=3072994 RepID=UPI00281145E2|nr:hypothetical protein [Marinobacter sp. F26243]
MSFRILLVLTPLVLAACSSPQRIEPTYDEHLESALLGTWNCTLEAVFPEGALMLSSTDQYLPTGKANSFGELVFHYSEYEDKIVYSVATSDSWQVVDGNLLFTTHDARIKNISHPGMDDILNIEELFPEDVSTASRIQELTGDRLVFHVDKEFLPVECDRADI